MKFNIWMVLFIATVIVAVVVIAYQDLRRADQPLIYYKDKYEDLQKAYIDLAKSHSYILETVMKNNVQLQSYLPDYANRTPAEFNEYLRRRIVAMQLEIERLDYERQKVFNRK
ncbi:MAG: hypothetical protein Q8K98_02970 [Bacteroidota bacterium]|nr:hypothetical protein [Bacteroidota bacterium]